MWRNFHIIIYEFTIAFHSTLSCATYIPHASIAVCMSIYVPGLNLCYITLRSHPVISSPIPIHWFLLYILIISSYSPQPAICSSNSSVLHFLIFHSSHPRHLVSITFSPFFFSCSHIKNLSIINVADTNTPSYSLLFCIHSRWSHKRICRNWTLRNE